MNSNQAKTAAASGAAGALTVLIVWALSLFSVTVPADVGAAFLTLAASAAGLVAHRDPVVAAVLAQVAPDLVAAPPAAPTPEVPNV